eukprot:TRINITY_DN2076_c0_g1_i13.p1 TRINITY_DN2076_c0_g1~~TRINITY_DN2076_c0_g1_i13.p1  ORF type:complete len:430 (+),score=103.76 TRINITY_DN2076_c0_g1_i13:63-1292(+)
MGNDTNGKSIIPTQAEAASSVNVPREGHLTSQEAADSPSEKAVERQKGGNDVSDGAVDVPRGGNDVFVEVVDAPRQGHDVLEEVVDAPRGGHDVPVEVVDAPRGGHHVSVEVVDVPRRGHHVFVEILDAPRGGHHLSELGKKRRRPSGVERNEQDSSVVRRKSVCWHKSVDIAEEKKLMDMLEEVACRCSDCEKDAEIIQQPALVKKEEQLAEAGPNPRKRSRRTKSTRIGETAIDHKSGEADFVLNVPQMRKKRSNPNVAGRKSVSWHKSVDSAEEKKLMDVLEEVACRCSDCEKDAEIIQQPALVKKEEQLAEAEPNSKKRSRRTKRTTVGNASMAQANGLEPVQERSKKRKRNEPAEKVSNAEPLEASRESLAVEKMNPLNFPLTRPSKRIRTAEIDEDELVRYET